MAPPPQRTRTSGGKPTGQQRPAPARPRPAPTSATPLPAAAVAGPPRVTLAVGRKVAVDEVDLSTGELAVPEATAAAVKEGGDLDLKVRLPGLAEGPLRVRKRGGRFHTVGASQSILLQHPALARFSAEQPTVLVLSVKDNQVGGWVGLGSPGPVKGNKQSLLDAMVKRGDLLGWLGLSKLRFPSLRNQFEAGVIDVAVEELAFVAGGFLSGSAGVALDNKALSFDGTAKVEIPGGSSGELRIKKDPNGVLAGKLDIQVQIGSVSGAVVATLSNGFVSVMGQVGYSGDRLSGKVTLVATDEETARDVTLAKPSAGGDVPIELPGPDKPVKPGKRAFCGWGQLTFRVTDWLAGKATVIVNSKGQATIVGEIAPPKEFVLFEQKEWIKNLFKLEIKAGYGIPVVGQLFVFANIGLDAIAKVGPGKLYDIKLSGAYSTDPRVPKQLSIEATLNISAFAGLRLRAEAGVGITILGHDLKAGVGLNAIAGVRGYVEATPRIGMREPVPGKREYYIQGHLEIAAQPVLGFSGDLFVSVDSPWWSPLPDKTWKWPLFELEYPLPGEFGIGADVDYVLGSKQWPKIEFGEVNFDSSKFMTDLLNDNTDSGNGAEEKKQGDWKEGLGAKGKGGAKNKGGSGKGAQGEAGVEPIGEEETFSDGGESHRLWFETKGVDAALMLASAKPARVERKLQEWHTLIPLLYEADRKKAEALLAEVRTLLPELDSEADKLAAMNQATRKAREVYEKNKGKKGKKGKKGRKGARELSKKLKADQRKVLRPLTALAVLLHKVKFTPVKRLAEMAEGTEPVNVVDRKTHAGLDVAKKKETRKLGDLLRETAPLTKHAVGGSGRVLIETSAEKLEQIIAKLATAPTKGGEINAGVLKTLEKPADQAAAVIRGIGQRLRIPSLERARLFVRIPAELLRRLEFKPRPKSPGDKLYARRFVSEMKRQLRDQQRGLSALSVDEWTSNLARFSVDARVFRALDTAGREEVIAVLKERTAAAKKRNEKTYDQIGKRLEALEDKKKLNQKEIRKLAEEQRRLLRVLDRMDATEGAEGSIAAAERGEIVAPDAKVLKPNYEGTREAMTLRIRGRQGEERKARDKVYKEDLERLIAREKHWKGLAALSSQLAILHRPDQVAGGYDAFEQLPTRPTRDDDDEGWKIYLDALKKMFGPGVVNSDIGRQWTKALVYTQALGDVRKAVPVKMSYPIHRLNLTLSVVE